jgi:hypothetical protein
MKTDATKFAFLYVALIELVSIYWPIKNGNNWLNVPFGSI